MYLYIFIFLIALIGMIILVFHISLEMNAVEKEALEFAEMARKHYEPSEEE